MPILSVTLPPPPSDLDARELALHFAPTRTSFLRIANSEALQLENGAVAFYAPSPLHIGVLFQQRIRPDITLRIDLEYAGESPSAPEIKWVQRGAKLMEFWAADTTAAKLEVAVAIWKQSVDQSVAGRLYEIRQGRSQRIEYDEDAVRRAQKRYFCALDYATNPTLLGASDELSKSIKDSTEVLMVRALARRTSAEEPQHKLDRDRLERLSAVQIAIAKAHFGNGTGIDLARFEAAYMAFATGALRETGEWNGIPNSAFFFLFAEFAFHAIDCSVDAEIWRELLPVFVHAQRLYVLAFPPYCETAEFRQYVELARRSFNTYMTQAESPRATGSLQIDEVLTMLRTKRDRDSLMTCHRENALWAFPRDDERPHPCDTRYSNITKEFNMTSWDFRKLLESMAASIGARKLPDFDKKYLKIADNHGAAVATYSLTDFTTNPPGGVTVGPVAMVHNVGANVGWLDHPDTEHVLITKDKITVSIPGSVSKSSRVDEYPMSHFDAFIVLIPTK